MNPQSNTKSGHLDAADAVKCLHKKHMEERYIDVTQGRGRRDGGRERDMRRSRIVRYFAFAKDLCCKQKKWNYAACHAFKHNHSGKVSFCEMQINIKK